MSNLAFLQLIGLAATAFFIIVAFGCYYLYQKLPVEKKVWAVGIFIMVLGIVSMIASNLPGYMEGQ